MTSIGIKAAGVTALAVGITVGAAHGEQVRRRGAQAVRMNAA